MTLDPFAALVSEPWMVDAACAQTDPDAWFPHKGDMETALAAVSICHTCPVLAECREYALSLPGNPDGIWGGLSAQRRKIIRREREAA